MEKRQETATDSISQPGKEFTGIIRINPKKFTDAFISDPDGGPDISINGPDARNTAMDGDLVQIRLNEYKDWKLNKESIADHWDNLAEYLLPIIARIQDEEKCGSASKEMVPEPSLPGGKTAKANDKKPKIRKKRSVPIEIPLDGELDSPKLNLNISGVPSNLPDGISKLQVAHFIGLPLAAYCLRKTGVVTAIIKRNHTGLAGGFIRPFSDKHVMFSPTDSRVPRVLVPIGDCPIDFLSQPRRYKNILFIAQLTEWYGNQKYALGRLKRIVGDCNDIKSRMETILLENQIDDTDFPADVYNELEYLNHLPSKWFKKESKGRRDLTNECIFTIDPKTARDLDDALSIKRLSGHTYEVGVHIADVSYFVKELTAVDHHARQRTTSVYLVDRVIPMLPRILCEKMCSLNPGEPKLTYSVIWKMNEDGHIIDQWFGRTVIRSCVKLAYEQAQDMIDRPNEIDWIREGVDMPKLHGFDWDQISKSVLLLNGIAKKLRARRFEGGALRIDQTKLKYELDQESGFPIGFSFETRSDANYLIEEFMLLANMAVARKIYDFSTELAFLRRHPSSCSQVLKQVKEFCDAKGYPLEISSSGALQKSLKAINDPTILKVVSFLLLRAMKNAEYVCIGKMPEDGHGFGHFALNVQYYTHFTSPIRRYADVIVHRLLSLSLDYEKKTNEDVETLAMVADECTRRKISSKLISDISQKLYFNLFVQKAGHCELKACVTKIYDHSFDVILIDYDRTGRVYIDRLKEHLRSFKFESFSGIKQLVLDWTVKRPKKEEATKEKSEKSGKSKKQLRIEDTQKRNRTSLESGRKSNHDDGLTINKAKDNNQVIRVFDVIEVIVTTDPKDITVLRIDLKRPDQ